MAPSPDQWNAHKDRLTRLYVLNNKTLEQIQDLMKTEYDFDATYVASLSAPHVVSQDFYPITFDSIQSFKT